VCALGICAFSRSQSSMDSTARTAGEIFSSAARIFWRRADLEFDEDEITLA
jgi:hypothetical protein